MTEEWSSRSEGLVLRLCTCPLYAFQEGVSGCFGLSLPRPEVAFFGFFLLVTLPVGLGIRAVRKIWPLPCLSLQYYRSYISYTYLWKLPSGRCLAILQHKNLIGLLSKKKELVTDISFGNVPILMPMFVSLVVLFQKRTNDRLWGY